MNRIFFIGAFPVSGLEGPGIRPPMAAYVTHWYVVRQTSAMPARHLCFAGEELTTLNTAYGPALARGAARAVDVPRTQTMRTP